MCPNLPRLRAHLGHAAQAAEAGFSRCEGSVGAACETQGEHADHDCGPEAPQRGTLRTTDGPSRKSRHPPTQDARVTRNLSPLARRVCPGAGKLSPSEPGSGTRTLRPNIPTIPRTPVVVTAPASPETPFLGKDGVMASNSRRYPLELRQRAVRMVTEVRAEHDSQWAAMGQVAQLLGVGTAETVRKWSGRLTSTPATTPV